MHFQTQQVPAGPMFTASAAANSTPGPDSSASASALVPTDLSASAGAPAQAMPQMDSVSTGAMASASTSGLAGALSVTIPGRASPVTSTATTTTTTPPTIEQIKNGPLAKAGQALITIFEEFQQQGAGTTFTPSQPSFVEIHGTNVGVDIQSSGGDFNAFVAKMNGLGMQIESQDPKSGTVEGFLPISQIATVAQDAQTQSISPIFTPQTLPLSMGLSVMH